MNREHLDWLEDLIFDGRPKFVLVNQTLARRVSEISRRLGALRQLTKVVGSRAPMEAVKIGGVVIYNGYSFSHSISNAYVAGLGKTIRSFIHAMACGAEES